MLVDMLESQRFVYKMKKIILSIIVFVSLLGFTPSVFAEAPNGLNDFYFYLDSNVSPAVTGSVFSDLRVDSNGYYYLPPSTPLFEKVSSDIVPAENYGVTFTLPVPLSPTAIQTSGLYLYVASLRGGKERSTYCGNTSSVRYFFNGNYNSSFGSVSSSVGTDHVFTGQPYAETVIMKIPLSSFAFGNTSSLINSITIVPEDYAWSPQCTGADGANQFQSMYVGSDIDITVDNSFNNFDYYFDGLDYFSRLMAIQIPDDFFSSTSADFLAVTSPFGHMILNNNMSFGGYYNSSGLYDTIRISLLSLDASSLYPMTIDIPINLPPLVTPIVSQDWLRSINLPNGNYTGSAHLYDSVNGISATGVGLYSYLDFTVSDGVPVAPATFFKSQEVCGFLDVACSVRNGFNSLGGLLKDIFGFFFSFDIGFKVPFVNMWDSISTKVPFAYIAIVVNAFNDISGNTDGDLNNVSISIGSSSIQLLSPSLLSDNPIAPLVRGSLVVVLWIMLVLAIYSRAIGLFGDTISAVSTNTHF